MGSLQRWVRSAGWGLGSAARAASSTVVTLLAASLLAPGAAHAGRADGVKRLIDLGQVEAAQKRCERNGGILSVADPDLRAVCAEAWWSRAAQEDTVRAWIRYQQVWAGTALAAEAREQEARAALRDLGQGAEPYHYQAFVDRYGDTKFASQAQGMMVQSSIQDALDDPDKAVATARRFPDHPDALLLLKAHPSRFLHVKLEPRPPGPRTVGPTGSMGTVTPVTPVVTVDPPILKAPPAARWAVQYEDGAVAPWDQIAEAHLRELGLGQPAIDALKRRHGGELLPCPAPGAGWTLGVAVDIGPDTVFLPSRGVDACHNQPTFLVLRGGKLAAISAAPGHLLEIAREGVPRTDGAPIELLGPVGEPVLTESAVVQPVGRLHLVTPPSGGMPWYEAQAPSSAPIPLSGATLGSSPLPGGWSVVASGTAIQPGAVASTPATVQAAALGQVSWTLPPGEIRVLSPVLALAVGLHPSNPAVRPVPLDPVPLLSSAQGPVGSVPLASEALPAPELQRLTNELRAMGIGVKLVRAWRASLHKRVPQVVFEGDLGGKPVRGVLDQASAHGWRVHLWARDPSAPRGDHDFFSFHWQDRAWVVWRDPRGAWMESLHVDDRGLVRSVQGAP